MSAKTSPFLTPAEANAVLPVPKTMPTIYRWLNEHPGLALHLGDRMHVVREAWVAVARGTPLPEAAKIGQAALDRMTGADSERAAA